MERGILRHTTGCQHPSKTEWISVFYKPLRCYKVELWICSPGELRRRDLDLWVRMARLRFMLLLLCISFLSELSRSVLIARKAGWDFSVSLAMLVSEASAPHYIKFCNELVNCAINVDRPHVQSNYHAIKMAVQLQNSHLATECVLENISRFSLNM